jgi:hypothetical protein
VNLFLPRLFGWRPCPKPFYKQAVEAAFYEAFFRDVKQWVEDCDAVVAEAEKVCSQFGLNRVWLFWNDDQ